jgi:DNA repair exonuclease SbcCD ATPase subunit
LYFFRPLRPAQQPPDTLKKHDIENEIIKRGSLVKKALLTTVALSVLRAGCNGSDNKTDPQTSSTFTELNNRIAQLDARQKQSQATIDEQNQKIVVLAPSQEEAKANAAKTEELKAELAALQKKFDETPKFDPATLQSVKDGLDDLTKQFKESSKFDPEALKKSLDELQRQLDTAPKSQAITDLDAAINDLKTKLADTTSFDQVKDEVARPTTLLQGIDADTLKTLKDTLASLRMDLDGKTTLDPATIQSITDRLAALEKLIATKADVKPANMVADIVDQKFTCTTKESSNIAVSTSAALIDKNPVPAVVPGVAKWQGGSGDFTLTAERRIVLEPASAAAL